MKKLKITGIILLTAFIPLGSCSEENLPNPPENPEASCAAPLDAITRFLQLDTINRELHIDGFLKIPDIPGESTDKGHEEEIDVLSIDWNKGVHIAGKIGGRGTVGRKIQSFVFTKIKDSASPKLKEAFATGKILPEAILTIRKTSGGQQKQLRFKLEKVYVTSHQPISGTGEELETISLNYAEVEIEK